MFRLYNRLVRCRYVDEISWVKKTRSGRLAKSHGFYLQHSKETCLVAKRVFCSPLLCMEQGKVKSVVLNQCTDVIWAERTGQSQKPIDIYEIIEKMIPGGILLHQNITLQATLWKSSVVVTIYVIIGSQQEMSCNCRLFHFSRLYLASISCNLDFPVVLLTNKDLSTQISETVILLPLPHHS